MLNADVLVVGAGPAGSAAARVLAAAGLRVLLADRHAFPRDKVCGDALIPDSLAALTTLGLRDRVGHVAHASRVIRIYAPAGGYAEVRGECSALPRAAFDELLVKGAVEAGAEFISHVRSLGALESDGIVQGARFENLITRERFDVRARSTILATGAAADALRQFGVCEQAGPSAMAARLYVQVPQSVADDHDYLAISYPAEICPGYGWVFPGPAGVFNVGIGYLFAPRLQPAQRNLRVLFQQFVRAFPPAREIMTAGTPLTTLKGAPLRTGLRGSRLSRPRLLVVGEAAGLTYSFTGEGIGKALQSGIAAASAILDANSTTHDDGRRTAQAYAKRIRTDFGGRFAAYGRLERLLSYPRMVNLLVRRANTGHYVRAQLEALVNETGRPDGLLSVSGALRALIF
jgi:geranylgeranyl reductase family protein